MILLFSFLLITLSAAHLGRDEQLTRVLGLPSAPTRQVAEKAESVPIQPSSSDVYKRQAL